MDRDTIRKAAWEYQKSLPYCDNAEAKAEYRGNCAGFVAGAEWRIESVWHDKTEEPVKNSYIAILDNSDEMRTRFYHEDTWRSIVNLYGLKKWAYQRDLIPELKRINFNSIYKK